MGQILIYRAKGVGWVIVASLFFFDAVNLMAVFSIEAI
jgi:hypothetical protein